MAKQSENADSQPGTAGGERSAKGGAARRAQPRGGAAQGRSSARRAKSAVALLKHLKGEHAQLDALFQRYESAEQAGKEEALRALAQELIIQMAVKEQVLYPALQEAKVAEAGVNEALVSYDVAKLLLRDILGSRSEDRYQDAKVAMLAQTVEHHVAKEEQPRQGLLAQAAGIDDAAVVSRMQERRKAIEAQGEDGMPDLAPTVTMTSQYGNRQPGFARRSGEDNTMPQNGPERDEHGRFMSHDDHRGGRGYGGGGGGGRGRMMEEDDRGRGMQSRGGRSHEEDDDHRGRGRSGGGGGGRDYGGGQGQDRSQGGWFGDSEGHSQASRQGWQTRYREGSEHDSGWHGDPQGHSQASRQGWQTRYREGTEHESGWHGDPEGHSEASRRGWETRYREGTEHESGWHGDPEGHSRASRMGWDTRRREGSDHFQDDDRGGRGRSGGGGGGGRGYGGGQGYGGSQGGRGGYESEGRGGSRSMSGGDGGRGYGGGGQGQGDRGQGDRSQGGWFGDSEGHSEASRRGWETRRHDDDDRGGRGRR